jgi:hypothetical protein
MKKPDKIEAAPLFEGESVKVGDVVTSTDLPDMKIIGVQPKPRKSQGVLPQTRAVVPAAPANPLAMLRDVMATIERVAGSNISAENLEKILMMQERIMDRQAKLAFNEAFVAMAPKLPQVTKDGRIIAKGVSKQTGREYEQDTPYAKWETISPQIVPILSEHGFSIRHRTETAPDHKIRIIAILYGHGHQEESYMDFEVDSTGSKNNAQGRVSATTYGRRITASAIINLVTKGEDDDGRASGRPLVVGEPLTEEQAGKLIEFCDAAELAPSGLLQVLNKTRPKPHPVAATLRDIPSSRFDEAVNWVRQYEAEKGERSK